MEGNPERQERRHVRAHTKEAGSPQEHDDRERGQKRGEPRVAERIVDLPTAWKPGPYTAKMDCSLYREWASGRGLRRQSLMGD